MKRSRIVGLSITGVVIICMAIVISLTFSQSNAEDIDALQKSQWEAYFTSQKEAIDLETKLGGNTPIGNLYASISYSEAIGVNEETAVKEAKEAFLEDEAFLWYANEKGLQISVEDVEAYMNEIITAAKDAENYPIVLAACEKAGISYEEFVRKNVEVYKASLIKDHFFNIEATSYNEAHPDSDYEEFITHWKNYKADVENQFRKTEKSSSVERVLSNCIEQIKVNKVDVSELKSKDIFLK